ncbi:MAG: lysophospholipid acyltransferase family protein [Mycobacterium sp.]
MEPVFRTLEIAAQLAVRATGTRITYQGLEHIPATGGGVVAINHTGYVDFLPAALAVMNRKRRLRFMIKAEMSEVTVVGWLIRHTGTITVDRQAGAGAYAAAVQALRRGELVGVYPEATISRSFELKDFKTQELATTMRSEMTQLLRTSQSAYPQPPGAFWLPRRLGGSAPTPAEAEDLDAAELAERARRRARRS